MNKNNSKYKAEHSLSDLPHESAVKHVTGESIYINDINLNDHLLIGKVVYSKHAHANIRACDLSKVRALQGVHTVLDYNDIPGENQMGPVVHDELCLAEQKVTFIGQAIFLIAAENEEIAIQAEKLINIEYEPLKAIPDIEAAIKTDALIAPPRKIECGNVENALKKSEHCLKGELISGAQEHWYLETQSCLAIPGEGKEMNIFSSTQHPSETQSIISQVLGVQKNEVVVEIRRMGGAFGGKETQGNHYAAWSALLANATRRPVKIHLKREEDQIMTGKRHRCLSKYEVGFNDKGIINALKIDLNIDAGVATDLSLAILERALFHVDNAYFIPNMLVIGKAWKTNLPPNTAFRGFGGPQAIALIENIIDRIARFLKKDTIDIRYKNFYKNDKNNITHYGQLIKNNRLFKLYENLTKSSDYFNRRKEINKFNFENEFYKKGLALTPVKFGISFTTSFLNQAGALVNIYQDGTVLVNHGGVEMGQGLHTKMQYVASAELGISPEFIKVNATNTSKVPNTSATAASSGSDLNGMAVKNAIEKLKSRIAQVVIEEFNKTYSENPSKIKNLEFKNNYILDKKYPERKIPFKQIIQQAYLKRVSLSATGFYKTPGIYYDKDKGKGNPFHYYAFGMAVSEIIIDTLTGQHKIIRTDILHDVGDSINKTLDKGQIEGGFIQGVGWCTTEDIKYDENGNLLNHSPDTYKIPTIRDIPEDFKVELLEGVPNPNTIRKSKAVGEPPFMLAFSVWLAIKDAISAVGNHEIEPEFSLPATNEIILQSIEKIKKKFF